MFLNEIIRSTENRIEDIKSNFDFPFQKALKKDTISFICEVKKASPSKGVIAIDFPYLEIAKEYELAGASAISVLTEPLYFLGSSTYLKEISDTVAIPTLRKDFIIDIYQIYEAKTWGASAVLLISEILDQNKLNMFIELVESLGMSALVEAHSLPQLKKALSAGAKIVGINNRNLETFEVDITTSIKLREYVPADVIFVSESGIKTVEDIRLLKEHKVDAVLIGEAIMRSKDKKAVLDELKS